MNEAFRSFKRSISTLLPHRHIGLKPMEHGLLNKPADTYPGGLEAKRKKVFDLRKKYRKDPTALTMLDLYDPDNNERADDLQKYSQALAKGDKEEAAYRLFREALRRRFGVSLGDDS